MTSYHFTLAATILAFGACCARARFLAGAFLPALALITARAVGLVDTSSAHHPLRFVVPTLGLSIAMASAWIAVRDLRELNVDKLFAAEHSLSPKWPRAVDRARVRRHRVLYASLLVFASCCVDMPATLLWDVPGVFLVQPLQTMACFAVAACLFAPERWLPWRSS